ncbi:hypothetical protein SLEP1_g52760 [Rubroshorea leprosula]|uniref:Uncharacterized protein n=1 Tax=Rubroshorea leprosula TaxID=152421 RepID=A0AAV5M875_9ROSI|nr:hypothetical protein SLEP1_g52760 [Rubroshorea leprosula]
MGHQCCNKQKVKKGLWSPEEDEKLVKYIRTHHGHGSWSSVPKLAGLQRCGKSCRLRWINYLRPDLKRGPFSAQEKNIIMDLHRIMGNRWAQIAKCLPGRTDNEVKNFWNSCIKKKLIAKGIDDPNTDNLISLNAYQIMDNIYTGWSRSMTTLLNSHSLSSIHEVVATTYENPNLADNIWTTKEQIPHSIMPMSFTPFHEPALTGVGQNECFWGTESTINEAMTQVKLHDQEKAIGCELTESSLMEFVSSSYDFEFVDSTLITNGLWSPM